MRGSLRTVLLALAFLATYGFTRAIAPVPPATPADLNALPMTLAPWAGVTAPPHSPAVMQGMKADAYIRRYYGLSEEEWVEMDVAYYAQPRVGATMHSPLNCLPGNGWQVTAVDTITLPTAAGAEVRSLTVARGESRFAIAYWFQSGDRVISSEAATRFQLLGDALRRHPSDAGMVRVMAPLTSGDARARVFDFAARLVPEVAKIFKRA